MRGTKRAATSDTAPVFSSNDPFVSVLICVFPFGQRSHFLFFFGNVWMRVQMQSKRVVMGSPLDGLKAEQSNPQLPLDMKRAESSKQHVRALNTQFARFLILPFNSFYLSFSLQIGYCSFVCLFS